MRKVPKAPHSYSQFTYVCRFPWPRSFEAKLLGIPLAFRETSPHTRPRQEAHPESQIFVKGKRLQEAMLLFRASFLTPTPTANENQGQLLNL